MRNINHYIKLQLKELEEHAWYLGEKLNRTPTEYETISSWILSGHADRFSKTYTQHEQEIERAIQEAGLVPILEDKNKLHRLLDD